VRRVIFVIFLAAAWLGSGLGAAEHDDDLAAWWRFDQQQGTVAIDSVGGVSDSIRGNFGYADGVTGKALRLDGYTTGVVRKAKDAPSLSEAFTIEAWVALQTLPWNWTAIVDQQQIVIPKKQQQSPGEITDEQLMSGLFGVRFKGPDLTRPDEEDTLKQTDNNWSDGDNNWSAQWHGYIEAPFTGTVLFHAEADNGLRFKIADKLVIDGWGKGKSRSGEITMVKGKKYPVVLTYYQDGGESILRLYYVWGNRGSRLIPPSVLWHSRRQAELVRQQIEGPVEPKEGKTHVFFGLDAAGRLAMKLNLSGQLYECVTKEKLALLKWSHVAATFEQDKALCLYINGKEVARHLKISGQFASKGLSDLLIGKSHQKLSPEGTERSPSRRLGSNMVLDGLLDEVKIYKRALSADEIVAAFASARPKTEQPLNYRVMPSGPKNLPKRFCAYYTRLRYDETWEKLWRVGEQPDILVTFDELPIRVVFWRGTNYGASWVTENGKWMGDQSLEDGGTGWGCCEHMSDKQCRYSHVRLIENHDARVVVHWRYAVCDIRYTINHEDPVTGWGDWTDEYYYIYPDAVATRKQVLWTGEPGGFQWQETIFFSQPGTAPEDNVELEAFTLANMQGETHSYSWDSTTPHDYPLPVGANIQMTNLKARYRPFIIFKPGREITAFGGGRKESKFPWWNHWPVAQLPNDGREVCGPDRPSSSSLSNRKPKPVRGEGDSYIAVSLYGMTDGPVTDVVPLARSWNYPADLKLAGTGYESTGYDRYQRAYVLSRQEGVSRSPLKFELAASEKSPVVNPAFVITGWGSSDAELTIDGKRVKRGQDFRLGHHSRLETTDLIVWLKKESTEPLRILLRRAPQ